MLERLFVALVVFLIQPAGVSIAAPQPGAVLRGQVDIVGNMDVPGFAFAELVFSYASHPAESGFVIQTFSQPAADSVIAVWDTSKITDGDYILRLHVLLQDGSSQDVVVSDLKVRNDEPLPTPPPAPTFPAPFFTSFPALTAPPAVVFPTFPSPTSLPVNPASVAPSSIYLNFARGALIALVLFAFFSLLLRLRKN